MSVRVRWLSLCLLLGGCVVGPDYVAPKLATPAVFGEADMRATTAAPDQGGWWRSQGDAELDRLVQLALRDSPDIAIAVARIEQARAAERVARAAFLPEVDATAATNYQKFSKNAGLSSLSSLFGGGGGGGGAGGGIAAPGNSIQTYTIGFDASWELDLFGGVARQVEGSRARTEAAMFNARDAQLSLIAEVADAYLQLRTLRDREAIARAEVGRQQRALAILEHTAQSGLVAQGDFIRQRAELAQAEAAVAPIVAEGKAQMHALGVLTGQTPDALIPELAAATAALPAPVDMPPGLPSELLRRRPDVRAAERNLAAATADVGVSVADLYPRLNLMSMADLISTSLATLLSKNSFQLTANAAATFPILDFGRRSGRVALNKGAADEAYYQYRRTVLVALRDVEDALIRVRTDRARADALRGGLADAGRAVKAVEARYSSGLIDYGDVLEARRSLLANQDQLASSEGAQRRDLIALHKALGGGWEELALEVPKPGAAAAAYTRPRR